MKVTPICGIAQSQLGNGGVGKVQLCKTGILEDGDIKATIK